MPLHTRLLKKARSCATALILLIPPKAERRRGSIPQLLWNLDEVSCIEEQAFYGASSHHAFSLRTSSSSSCTRISKKCHTRPTYTYRWSRLHFFEMEQFESTEAHKTFKIYVLNELKPRLRTIITMKTACTCRSREHALWYITGVKSLGMLKRCRISSGVLHCLMYSATVLQVRSRRSLTSKKFAACRDNTEDISLHNEKAPLQQSSEVQKGYESSQQACTSILIVNATECRRRKRTQAASCSMRSETVN